ncbi:MAG: glycosyltransferase family 4 protein, partial [Acetobacteraceae bacterium]|nr:glycosyltransferase family 4 protein [Acetobacteraceae bacterium]
HHLRIQFLLALRDRGFRVSAASPADPAPFQRVGIQHHALSFKRYVNPLSDRATIEAARTLLEQVRPDLVQSFDTKPNILVPLAARGERDLLVVRTINGMGWVYSSKSPTALGLRVVQRALHRVASRSVAMTIFQNRQDQQLFHEHGIVGQGLSQLVPGSGIDVEKFAYDLRVGPSAAQLRQELGLGRSEIVITVTRLTRQKGIPALLKAAAIVHKVRPSVRFLLVGPRESEGALAISQDELARHAPYVAAIGARSDVPSLLRLADLFAFPTQYREGVPRVLLEAGLAGLPIVTTDMPGCNDVVRDGWSGYLVPAGSHQRLAARILDLLRERQVARLMGQRLAECVRQEFNLMRTVDRYCAAYSRLLERLSVPRGRFVQGRVPVVSESRS